MVVAREQKAVFLVREYLLSFQWSSVRGLARSMDSGGRKDVIFGVCIIWRRSVVYFVCVITLNFLSFFIPIFFLPLLFLFFLCVSPCFSFLAADNFSYLLGFAQSCEGQSELRRPLTPS